MANKKVPGSITLDDFTKIDGDLRKILQTTGAKEAHLRLNDSDDDELAPYFVGWVEDSDLKSNREAKNHPDPGLYRFGDPVLSSVYLQAYEMAKNAHQAILFSKNWDGDLHQKRLDEKALAPKAGVMHQKCMGIVLKKDGVDRFVGTLNVGFAAPPSDSDNATIENVITQWADPATSTLVQWLDTQFTLFGPPI